MLSTTHQNLHTCTPKSHPSFGQKDRSSLGTLWIALLTLVTFLSPTILEAQEEPPPTRDQASYWGQIPAPSDSVTHQFQQRGAPLWEKTLLVPYTVVGLPFSLLKTGLKGTVIFLDENKIIYRVSSLLGQRRGPFGLLLNFKAGGLSGFGGGVSAVHEAFFSPDNKFKLRWESTTRGSHRLNLGLRINDLRSAGWELGGGYHVRPNARFFGVGPGAQESMESFYTQETGWAGLSRRTPLPADLMAEEMVVYSSVGARGPADDDEYDSIDSVFASAKPFGLRDRSDGVTVSLTLTHDTTSEDGRPERQGSQELKASYFKGSDDVSFWTFRAEAEQFIHLVFSKQVLALRGHVTWIEDGGAGEVPFQRLLTNDDPDLLRGYRDFRWRDRGLTALSVEYRWPIWANKTADGIGLDAYLLTDIGQVFGEFEEISFSNLADSYGFGIRLIGNSGFKGRLEVAWSDEDTVIRLRADQVFQFAKGGLFHGRDQVALR